MLINLLLHLHLCQGIALLPGVLLRKQLYVSYFSINYVFKKAMRGRHLFPFDLVSASLKGQGRDYFCTFAHLKTCHSSFHRLWSNWLVIIPVQKQNLYIRKSIDKFH